MKKLKVLVLCGGKSAERRVSLVSAKFVLENLDRRKYIPRLVFIDRRGRWFEGDEKLLSAKVGLGETQAARLKGFPLDELFLSDRGPDVVFPALHGPLGEDGTVQGLLEVAGIAYVGCGVASSALCMDKELTKRLALAAGLPTLPFVALNDPDLAPGAAKRLGLPVFVKPARMGSSVGVSKVKTGRELARAVREAFRYDDKIIIEKAIPAREIECALLGDPWRTNGNDPLALRSSICGEIRPTHEFYSYESKYLDPAGADLVIPAAIPPASMRRVRRLAEDAFRALDGYGMARADFLMDKRSGAVYFNEINTIPGFTSISMYPLLWKASGVPAPRLLDRLIRLALRRGLARSRLETTP